MIAGLLALTAAAIFTGAAIYLNLVEQPARLTLDDHALLKEWQPSYRRGTAMQGSIAIVAFLLGLLAWWQTGALAFLAGAVVSILPWPWTLLVIMPTNHALEATQPAAATSATRALIERWGRLHTVRTVLGAIATLAYLAGCRRLFPT